MPILEISIIPLGTKDASFGNIVVESCKNINDKDLDYKITPTSTIIEGDIDDLLAVAKRMHEAPFKFGVDRVITSIKLDERHDKPTNMNYMVEEVTESINTQ